MRNVGGALRLAVLAALGACGGKLDDGSNGTCTFQAPAPTGSNCTTPWTVPINGKAVCGLDSGTPSLTDCAKFCGTTNVSCTATDTAITCQSFCGKARTSMRRKRSRGPALAAHLRDSVWLEAASVDAFRTLARELEAHRAPISLRRAAREAADDETRHTRATIALAARHGVRTRAKYTKVRTPKRALVDVAIENAVEGCVHETFGAALALFQSKRASDARDRETLLEIARDEARHAALAEKIDAWAKKRLSAEERARVDVARASAANALVCGARRGQPRALGVLGMPNAAESEAIVRSLAAHLWS